MATRRLVPRALFAGLALSVAGLAAAPAAAQHLSNQASSPPTYSAAGQNLTISVSLNFENNVVNTADVRVVNDATNREFPLPCAGLPGHTFGVAVTCSGTYTTDATDFALASIFLRIYGGGTGNCCGGNFTLNPVFLTVANSGTSISISQSPNPITAGSSGTVTIHVSARDGVTATGNLSVGFNGSAIPLSLSGGSASFSTGTLPTAGTLPVTVDYAGDASHSPNTATGSVFVQAPLIIVQTSIPRPVVGAAYLQVLTPSGGTGTGYAFTLSGGTLPAGLTLETDGTLHGTASTAGAFDFTVGLRDSAFNSTTRQFTGFVNQALSLTANPPVGNTKIGNIFTQTNGANGGTAPYTYSITGGSLPAGVNLDPGGVISGTPTAAGPFSYDVTVTDSTAPTALTDTKTVSGTIAKDDQGITFTSTPNNPTVGATYVVTATGGGSVNPVVLAINAASSTVCSLSGNSSGSTGQLPWPRDVPNRRQPGGGQQLQPGADRDAELCGHQGPTDYLLHAAAGHGVERRAGDVERHGKLRPSRQLQLHGDRRVHGRRQHGDAGLGRDLHHRRRPAGRRNL